jgi:hypothetical protein
MYGSITLSSGAWLRPERKSYPGSANRGAAAACSTLAKGPHARRVSVLLLGGLLCALALKAHAGAIMPVMPNTSVSVIGANSAQIAAKFPGVIEANMRRPGAAVYLAGLTQTEWDHVASMYGHLTGNPAGLAAIINVYAPAQAAKYKAAQTRDLPVPGLTGPNPTLDMTLEEIYLEFRTAPVGALSVDAALFETATYASGPLMAAGTAGYTIGQGIDWLLQTFAPNVWEGISNTVGNVVTGLQKAFTAGSAAGIGENEWLLATVMGLNPNSVYDPDGDEYGASGYMAAGDWSVEIDLGSFSVPSEPCPGCTGVGP